MTVGRADRLSQRERPEALSGSSGLSVLSDWVHEKYGFDYSVSNDLLHENGILTGEVRIQVRYDKKAEWVEKILARFGLRSEESLAIGDSKGIWICFRKSDSPSPATLPAKTRRGRDPLCPE